MQDSKQTKAHFPKNEGSTSKPLELVHIDLCGPSRKNSSCEEEFFILFIDDFSRMCWIGLLNHKDEAFEKFKALKALVEYESDHKIKCLRSDRGGEFTSDDFFDFFEEHGIKRELSTSRRPQQNRVIERMNRTIQQMAQAMLDESGTPATFCAEATFAAITILNKKNIRVNNTQSHHELWYGKTPTVNTSKFLEENSTSKGLMETLAILNLEHMKEFFLVTLPKVKDISVIIKDFGRVLKVLMLWLMKQAKIQSR